MLKFTVFPEIFIFSVDSLAIHNLIVYIFCPDSELKSKRSLPIPFKLSWEFKTAGCSNLNTCGNTSLLLFLVKEIKNLLFESTQEQFISQLIAYFMESNNIAYSIIFKLGFAFEIRFI